MVAEPVEASKRPQVFPEPVEGNSTEMVVSTGSTTEGIPIFEN